MISNADAQFPWIVLGGIEVNPVPLSQLFIGNAVTALASRLLIIPDASRIIVNKLDDAGSSTSSHALPRLRVHVAQRGVPATQVAEWAGHSVEVLLKVYATCLDGQDEIARRRVQEALGHHSPSP